jgi:hypothetical protein
MSDLKKLVESTTEKTLVSEEVELINENVHELLEYVQDLNDAFNNDYLTEEEYYELLEDGMFGRLATKWGAGQKGQKQTTGSITTEPGRTKVQAIGNRRQGNTQIDQLIQRAQKILNDPKANTEQKKQAQQTIQKWNARKQNTETGKAIA